MILVQNSELLNEVAILEVLHVWEEGLASEVYLDGFEWLNMQSYEFLASLKLLWVLYEIWHFPVSEIVFYGLVKFGFGVLFPFLEYRILLLKDSRDFVTF